MATDAPRSAFARARDSDMVQLKGEVPRELRRRVRIKLLEREQSYASLLRQLLTQWLAKQGG